MSYVNSDQHLKNGDFDPNKDSQFGSINDRIRELLKGRTTRKAAEDWGIPLSTLSAYLSRGSMPSADKVYKIMDKEGVSLEWLVTGKESEPAQKEAKDTSYIPLVYVEKHNVVASAGGGAHVDEESVVDYYPFSMEYLKKQRISHCDLSIIEARGDSMEPTIESGDDIVIAKWYDSDNMASQGVHVINLDGDLRVKRLKYDIANDGYRIISDNPLYKEEFVKRAELDRMRIIGEVVMVMGAPSKWLPETN